MVTDFIILNYIHLNLEYDSSSNRLQKNTLPVSPPSIKSYNLYELIAVDPILTDYFKR